MIGQLHKTNAGTPLSLRLVHCGHHQLTTHPSILHLWIDGNRSEADNARAKVDEVAAEQATSIFRDHAVEFRMVQQQGGNAVSGLRGIEIWREVVPVGDTLEGRIHDRRNSSQIACGRRASRY
jgi:hypothetical protein